MADYNLHALKFQQDELAERRRKLLQKVEEFRSGLLDGLGVFIRDASKAGLAGLKPCETRRHTDDLLLVALTLNDCPLLLVWIAEVLHERLDSDFLASKILVYPDAPEQDVMPWFEIEVRESGRGRHCYEVRWLHPRGAASLTTPSELGERAGRSAASALIDILYNKVKFSWAQTLPLSVVLGDTSRSRQMGFSPN